MNYFCVTLAAREMGSHLYLFGFFIANSMIDIIVWLFWLAGGWLRYDPGKKAGYSLSGRIRFFLDF